MGTNELGDTTPEFALILETNLKISGQISKPLRNLWRLNVWIIVNRVARSHGILMFVCCQKDVPTVQRLQFSAQYELIL